jgi:hypothetical protein
MVTTISASATTSKAPGVQIKAITVPQIAYDSATTVKPNVTTRGKVKIVSKALTVKGATWRGARVSRKNVKRVALPAGNYSVKTTVRYKAKLAGKKWSRATTTSKTQRLAIAQAPAPAPAPARVKKTCVEWSDFDQIASLSRTGYLSGDSRSIVESKLWSDPVLTMSGGNLVIADVIERIDVDLNTPWYDDARIAYLRSYRSYLVAKQNQGKTTLPMVHEWFRICGVPDGSFGSTGRIQYLDDQAESVPYGGV